VGGTASINSNSFFFNTHARIPKWSTTREREEEQASQSPSATMSSPFDAWIEDNEGAEPRPVSPGNENDNGSNLDAEGSFDWYEGEDADGDWFGNPSEFLDAISDDASLGDPSSSLQEESNNNNIVVEEEENVVLEEPEEGYKKTITFADTIATPMGVPVDMGVPAVYMGVVDMQMSESSLQSSLLFGEQKGSSEGGGSTSENEDDEDEEEEEDSADAKIKRQLMYTFGGMGLFALLGFGIQKIQSAISKNNTDDIDAGGDITNTADTLSNANDVASMAAGDGGSSTYSSAASAAQTSGDIANVSFNTSTASASQSNLSMAGFGMGGQGGTSGMSVMQ
jgi:hypothetical protein